MVLSGLESDTLTPAVGATGEVGVKSADACNGIKFPSQVFRHFPGKGLTCITRMDCSKLGTSSLK